MPFSALILHAYDILSHTRYAMPVLYPFREFVEDGGLISYGNKLQDSYHWAGVDVGRILKGEKPGHLPARGRAGRAEATERVVSLAPRHTACRST